jgi:peptide deformylase
MAILKIYHYPAEVLRQKALQIDNIDGELQSLIDNMVETMYRAPGVGLAANQVGILKRLFVVDISSKEKAYPLLVILNPVITFTEGEDESEEGCLSLPGCSTKIKRARDVVVKGIDREGKPIEVEASGLLARAIQHELDHLDGIVLFDRLSPIKREFLKKRYLKRLRAEGKP